ncbi:MAG: hypothetical protein KDA93_21660 [Planctomycetaceae bacterium]|nr:hypothetical protein [Planctomycetaceae bacterium]
MGVDYIPIRLEPTVSDQEIEEAVHHQIFEVLEARLTPTELNPLVEEELSKRRPRRAPFDKERTRFEDLLLFKRDYHRVSTFTFSPVFPAEWRVHAYRTILPRQLPDLVDQWSEHLHLAADGRYRRYLFEWYVYETRVQLVSIWANLHEAVRETQDLDFPWTQKSEFRETRESVLAADSCQLVTLPRWSDYRDVEEPASPETDERYRDLLAEYERLIRLIRRWNKDSKRPIQFPSEWMDVAWDDWLHATLDLSEPFEFLKWATRWSSGGYGLYIDY